MKRSFFVSAAFAAITHFQTANAAASSGCGNALSTSLKRGGAVNTNSLTFTTSGGVVRSYLMHIPTAYDVNTPAPLAFSYHGRTETPADQESISGMSNETFNPNYLVIYPAGIDAQWQGDPEAVGYDDIGFTLELLTNISSTFCIDSSRVYAAGKSNGGGFSANVLACDPQASRIFAAFGGMSGAYYQGTTDVNCVAGTVPITCNPGRSVVPIFTTHGNADTTINYNGGPRRGRCLPSLPHFMTEAARRDGVGTSNTSTLLYNGNVQRFDYGSDSLAGIATHYYVNGLGHTWPSIAAGTWFDATPLLLAFWNKWTLDTTSYQYVAVSSTSTGSGSASATSTSSTVSTSSLRVSTTTTASSMPSASLCPAVNGQTITDINGNNYTVTCSSDNSVGSYSNKQASTSYLDCMTACDAASSTGCQGFTYVGGANGSGSGTCWLKTSMKTYTSAGNNYISAVKKYSGSSVSSASSSIFSSSTSTSIPAASTASALSCPASNNTIYTYASTNAQYVIECGIDHQAGDLASTSVKNLEGCIAACAMTSGCIDVSLSGSACYMKKTLGAAVSNGGILGAKFVGSASSSASIMPTSGSSTSISPTSGSSPSASSTLVSSSFITSTLASSSSTSAISSASLVDGGMVGADGYTTTSFPPACTAINSNTYAVTDNLGSLYIYQCGAGSGGSTAQTIANVANWTVCFNLCDSYAGCSGFTYNLGAAFGNGVGQCLIKTGSQSFASTSVLTTTRIAALLVSSATSSSTNSAASSLISVLATTSSSIVPSSSSSVSAKSSTSSTSSSILSTSSSTSSSNPSLSASSSSLTPSTSSPISTAPVSSSSSSSSIISIPTKASASVGTDGYTTTTFPPTCTAINTNIYAVADSAETPYLYMCGGGSAGNTVNTVTNVANWTACFQACDNYNGCTGFSYNQGAVYGNGVGQCLLKADNPQSFVSTATLLSTRIAGYIRSATTTSASVKTTSTG